MSVIIKGMEMPSGCNTCQLRDLCFDYYVCRAKKLEDGRYLDINDVVGRRHRCCPLVEIPTPHGRLIDADELIRCLPKWLADTDVMRVFERIIKRHPTIIEAEE